MVFAQQLGCSINPLLFRVAQIKTCRDGVDSVCNYFVLRWQRTLAENVVDEGWCGGWNTIGNNELVGRIEHLRSVIEPFLENRFNGVVIFGLYSTLKVRIVFSKLL